MSIAILLLIFIGAFVTAVSVEYGWRWYERDQRRKQIKDGLI